MKFILFLMLIAVGSHALSYCDSRGQSVVDEYIFQMSLGDIDSGVPGIGDGGGYSNLTSKQYDFLIDGSESISIEPFWAGNIYSEGYAVWIDYNQDGDFSDSNERVVAVSPTKKDKITETITVPSGALAGFTRMRVSMKYNGIPAPCEEFLFGEVEDYSVEVIPPEPKVPHIICRYGGQEITYCSVHNVPGNIGVHSWSTSANFEVVHQDQGAFFFRHPGYDTCPSWTRVTAWLNSGSIGSVEFVCP